MREAKNYDLRDNQHLTFIVYGNKIVGNIELYDLGGTWVEIGYIFIYPKHRRKGYAEKTVEHITEYADTQASCERTEEAEKFWISMGIELNQEQWDRDTANDQYGEPMLVETIPFEISQLRWKETGYHDLFSINDGIY